ncbi:preprotein translocase subunit YajC [Candidatus Endowatersipora endosymbiont of Watersipora subatra]|uniref:preprotein translocase subunit YajC n=1 Tax=Candidatus Endowatersipora endosymbiont of Watersipora subatra TaxID=3077946 RepID=UPI00312C9A9B
MFIKPAYAQSLGGAGNGIVEFLVPVIAIGAIMWFLVIRPQRQQQKKRDQTLSKIRRNDIVVTGGGIIGRVTKIIDDSEIEIMISAETKVKILRSLIADVRVRGEPIKSEKSSPKKDDILEKEGE